MKKLLNNVCLIELYNLKKVCKFYYKGELSEYQKIYLNNNEYLIHDENININKKNMINICDKWKNTFFYKDAFNDNNLFYNYLKSKYRV